MCNSLICISLLLAGELSAAELLRDPTRPETVAVAAASSAPAAEAAALKLSLLRLGAKPMAVINGQALRPGDAIAGYRLLAIAPGHVLLQGSEGKLSLKLATAPVTKTKVRP